MPNKFDNETIMMMITSILIAIFGSSAKEVSKIGDKKLNFRDLIVKGFVSAFVGMVIGLLCLNFNIPMALTLALSGLSGWIGSSTLEIVGYIVQKKLGIDSPFSLKEEDKKEEKKSNKIKKEKNI